MSPEEDFGLEMWVPSVRNFGGWSNPDCENIISDVQAMVRSLREKSAEAAGSKEGFLVLGRDAADWFIHNRRIQEIHYERFRYSQNRRLRLLGLDVVSDQIHPAWNTFAPRADQVVVFIRQAGCIYARVS